jgi:subtilisin family serine protease
MDGGFYNTDLIDFFAQDQIMGVKNFTHEGGDPRRETMSHGTKVLSCMLANKPAIMIGTAPQANYYLFKTEVNDSEYPVEEDYWVAALEYADSLGVDITSTSLGYNLFDDPSMNHTLAQLDGVTVPASRAASMAASKGMVVINSAGNEAGKVWGKIMFPSDADHIICVGAVTADSARSSFSSLGYAADGRVKPDVMAMGTNTAIVNELGNVVYANGTSFACPVMAGLTASLWGALPELTSYEIMSLIRENADRFTNPNPQYGYGIADIFKSYNEGLNIITGVVPSVSFASDDCLLISKDQLCLKTETHFPKTCLSIYNSLGIRVLFVADFSGCLNLHRLDQGIYIAVCQQGNQKYTRKFIVAP